MKKKYLIIAIIIFLLNIPIIILNKNSYLISFIITFTSCIFFIKYTISNINILNEECNPKKFLELNKNNSLQSLNNCFAILHMYHSKKEDRELFMKYYTKAKNRLFKNDTYQMKLEYLLLNFRMLNNESNLEEAEDFDEKWLNNNFLNKKDKKNIHYFLSNEKYNCLLSSVTSHFSKGCDLYNQDLYEMAKSEFEYVSKFGGTTIYKEISDKYLDELIEYKSNQKIEKDKISIIDKYLNNKLIIDNCFCLYLILFLLTILI